MKADVKYIQVGPENYEPVVILSDCTESEKGLLTHLLKNNYNYGTSEKAKTYLGAPNVCLESSLEALEKVFESAPEDEE